jgi:hypothetical protein
MSSTKKAEIAYSIIHSIITDYLNKSLDIEIAKKHIAKHFAIELNSKGYFNQLFNINSPIENWRFSKALDNIKIDENYRQVDQV